MKIKVRRGMWESNSSSSHSLCMMMKSDYDKWQNEDFFIYSEDSTYGWDGEDRPHKGQLYTKQDVINFIKINKYYSPEIYDEYLNTENIYIFNDFVREEGFISSDYESNLEEFYEEFTTPNNETIVAFGEYGYDY